MALRGIDVSAYQENINWEAVANGGISFGFAKATEGAQDSDAMFASHWAGMKSVGIIRGAYHFFMASKDPIEQANNFLRTTQKLMEVNDLPPVLDLEKTYWMNPASVLDRAQQWLDAVQKATGRQPIVYTFPTFWHESLGDTTRLSKYPLWIAHYETDQPWVPGGWKTWTFHQFSESGSIAGYGDNIDLNNFQGGLDDLQKLIPGKVPLRVGSKGQIVMALQQALKTKGFDVGTIDGSFGGKTKAAVMAFQKSAKLGTDGIVGLRTWAALGAAPTTPVATPPLTLINVCKSYDALPHQTQALQWLQQQIPKAVLDEFTKQWRQDSTPSSMFPVPLTLINVCKSYSALPNQDQALKGLQQKLPKAIMDAFTLRWRSNP
jgi:lysozyme